MHLIKGELTLAWKQLNLGSAQPAETLASPIPVWRSVLSEDSAQLACLCNGCQKGLYMRKAC